MRAVLAADPNAKFCIGGGSQLHAPFTTDPWFPKVWGLLPNNLKPKIQAIHTHYYPQSEVGPDSDLIYSAEPIKKYLKSWRRWIKNHAQDIPRELWVTEIGLIWTATNRSDSRAVLYPMMVQAAMDGLAERWAWYSQSKAEGYATLWDRINFYPDL